MKKEAQFRLFNEDCLKVLKTIERASIDLVLTDLPYGTTACKWDTIIPFDEMWELIDRVIKPETPILLFGTEPFSSHLRLSNLKNYRYDWIWIKDKGTNIFTSKKRPMQNTELISVFYKKQPSYFPIMRQGKPYIKIQKNSKLGTHLGEGNRKASDKINMSGERYPLQTVYFARDTTKGTSFHPTQKPINLLRYLIRTYTKKGDVVLDFTMGSGSTGVACKLENRKFIGIEKDEDYFKTAFKRIYGIS